MACCCGSQQCDTWTDCFLCSAAQPSVDWRSWYWTFALRTNAFSVTIDWADNPNTQEYFPGYPPVPACPPQTFSFPACETFFATQYDAARGQSPFRTCNFTAGDKTMALTAYATFVPIMICRSGVCILQWSCEVMFHIYMQRNYPPVSPGGPTPIEWYFVDSRATVVSAPQQGDIVLADRCPVSAVGTARTATLSGFSYLEYGQLNVFCASMCRSSFCNSDSRVRSYPYKPALLQDFQLSYEAQLQSISPLP